MTFQIGPMGRHPKGMVPYTFPWYVGLSYFIVTYILGVGATVYCLPPVILLAMVLWVSPVFCMDDIRSYLQKRHAGEEEQEEEEQTLTP